MNPWRVVLRAGPVPAALWVVGVFFSACVTTGTPSASVSEVHAPPAAPLGGAVGGTVGSVSGQPLDGQTGPLVVILEPADSPPARVRPQQLFHITSSTDRFEPAFTTVAKEDFIVLVNGGRVAHRFFSAALGNDRQIPVLPAASSEPQRLEVTGELRFFCALHPDENFSMLVTGDAFSAVVQPDGSFYIAPVPAGSYRLSVWNRGVQSAIRTVQVDALETVSETIRLDPSALRH